MAVKTKKKQHIPQSVKEAGVSYAWKQGRVTLSQEPDEENPKRTVTRIRVKSSYDEMFKRGTITQEQRDCAERYVILWEKALGSTGDLYAHINFLKGGRGNWEPSSSQHEAYEKLFRVWESVGRYHREIINMIALGNVSTKEISKIMNISYPYAIGQVSSAFILLEEAFREFDNVVAR